MTQKNRPLVRGPLVRAELESQRLNRVEKRKNLGTFIKDIENRPVVLEEFDEKLWMAIVDKVTVLANGKLSFCFKDGTCVEK